MHFLVLRCTSPIIGEVKYAARIGEMHKPCGTLVRIGWSSSLLPSRQMVVHQSCRKVCTHCTIGSGKCCEWSVSSRCEWGMVLKNPVMSNVRIEALRLWFHAISMSCTVQRRASSADLLGMPPNWDDGKRLCLAAMCDSWHACMCSRTLLSTSSASKGLSGNSVILSRLHLLVCVTTGLPPSPFDSTGDVYVHLLLVHLQKFHILHVSASSVSFK